MRARLALLQTGISVELREILLKDKPQEMREIAPKKTVPVLQFADGRVLDESLDIMQWSVKQDGGKRLNIPNKEELALITRCDHEFKPWLDRYKYHVGYPEHPQDYYRDQAMSFLRDLDVQLEMEASAANLFASGDFADLAVFPFVRQFAYVDKDWFDQEHFEYLDIWLARWLGTELFEKCMQKFPVWQSGTSGIEFGGS
jgi:glutathione S-transferase